MKKIFLFLVANLLFFSLFAQQVPLTGHYYKNRYLYNPAQMATLEYGSVSAIYRNQWMGTDGAPQTITVAGAMPMHNDSIAWRKNLSIGGLLYQDRAAMLSTTGFRAMASRFFTLKNESRLSVGLGLGGIYNSRDMGTPIIGDQNDAFLAQLPSAFQFDMTFSVMLATKKGMQFGYAMHYGLQRGSSLGISNPLTGYLTHSMFTFSHKVNMGGASGLDEGFYFEPHLVYRFATTLPGQVEANMIFGKGAYEMKHLYRYWAGVGYTTSMGINGMLGINVTPQFGFSYTYTHPTGDAGRGSIGSHEIMITYNLKQEKAWRKRKGVVEEKPAVVEEVKPNETTADVTTAVVFGADTLRADKLIYTNIEFEKAAAGTDASAAVEFTEESYAILDKWAEFLILNKAVRIEIRAHVDGTSSDFAKRVTDNRAKVISDYLANKAVQTFRLNPVGYGATIPNASGGNNERIEFRILSITED